jgi:hypothetical protein
VNGAGGTMALVLAEAVAGSLAFLWLSPIWHEVKRSYFRLNGAIFTALAAATWLSARAGQVEGSQAGAWSVRMSLAATLTIALWTGLAFAKRDAAARVIGFVSVVVALGMLVAMAFTGRQAFPVALFQLLAGAAFLGTVTDGLMLGHWYLTDRGLGREPINRFTNWMLIAVVVEAIAVISGGFGSVGENESFNPLLTAGALAPWIALGMVASTGLIGLLTRAALKGTRASAVQSATGFYYLAVVTAFTAEVAVKTRFLAG